MKNFYNQHRETSTCADSLNSTKVTKKAHGNPFSGTKQRIKNHFQTTAPLSDLPGHPNFYTCQEGITTRGSKR